MIDDLIVIDKVEDGFAVASLQGEHDLSSAAELRDEISGLLAEGSAVVVDLSAATFIDSSILSVLIGARAAAKAQGVGFALLLDESTAPVVRRALEVTGLMTVFWIASDRAGAVDAVRRSARLN